ncbi:hypothetical protein, partial [Desulfobotulus alkaliphilus]|uniref:hypothetical protein n=1 Tax=Desulfobotulus alkaliphilus TaxID=622671 RepID=UPI001C9778AC
GHSSEEADEQIEGTGIMINELDMRSPWSEGPWQRESLKSQPVAGTQSPDKSDEGLGRLRAASSRRLCV